MNEAKIKLEDFLKCIDLDTYVEPNGVSIDPPGVLCILMDTE